MILVKRKLFRMIGFLFPVLYLVSGLLIDPPWDKAPVLTLLTLFIGVMVWLESWRFLNPKVNRWLFKHFKGFTKEKERAKISTTTLFLASALITIGGLLVALAWWRIGLARRNTVTGGAA